jgi:hypothetical protein
MWMQIPMVQDSDHRPSNAALFHANDEDFTLVKGTNGCENEGLDSRFSKQISGRSQAWWRRPMIPPPGKLRQEDLKFEACLSYTERLYLKTNKQNQGVENQSKNLLKKVI